MDTHLFQFFGPSQDLIQESPTGIFSTRLGIIFLESLQIFLPFLSTDARDKPLLLTTVNLNKFDILLNKFCFTIENREKYLTNINKVPALILLVYGDVQVS